MAEESEKRASPLCNWYTNRLFTQWQSKLIGGIIGVIILGILIIFVFPMLLVLADFTPYLIAGIVMIVLSIGVLIFIGYLRSKCK